jgi:hypothetical protein
MTDDHPELPRVEVDHTLFDLTFLDDAGQPLGHGQLACLIDCTSRQIINWWFEAPAAPTSEEPLTAI